jgi:hypothetical protein
MIHVDQERETVARMTADFMTLEQDTVCHSKAA